MMIELLMGAALVVAIVTMIGHFWAVWRPIFIWTWRACRLLLQIAFCCGVLYGTIRLCEYLWENAGPAWQWANSFTGKNGMPIVQLVGIFFLVMLGGGLITAWGTELARALGRERVGKPANMTWSVIVLIGSVIGASVTEAYGLNFLTGALLIVAALGFAATLFFIFAPAAFDDASHD